MTKVVVMQYCTYGSMLAVTFVFQYPTDRCRLLGRAIVWAAPWGLVCVLVPLLRAIAQEKAEK